MFGVWIGVCRVVYSAMFLPSHAWTEDEALAPWRECGMSIPFSVFVFIVVSVKKNGFEATLFLQKIFSGVVASEGVADVVGGNRKARCTDPGAHPVCLCRFHSGCVQESSEGFGVYNVSGVSGVVILVGEDHLAFGLVAVGTFESDGANTPTGAAVAICGAAGVTFQAKGGYLLFRVEGTGSSDGVLLAERTAILVGCVSSKDAFLEEGHGVG